MKTKKILFVTDLDGTFIFDSVAPSEAAKQALKSLDATVDLAIATGRSIKEVDYVIAENNLNCKYRIGFNGAHIKDQNNMDIKLSTIPQVTSDGIIHFLLERKITFDALDGEKRIGNFMHEKSESLWNMELVCKENPLVDLAGKIIYKINVRPTAAEVDAIEAELRSTFPEIDIFRIGNKRLEITMKDISKGEAVEIIGVDYDQIITVGDASNDISMFAVADMSICMEHADSKTQNEASHIVEDFATAVKLVEKEFLL